MQVRRFVFSTSLYLLANVASRIIGFVMIPVYSRFLSPAEYGLVELIELTIQVVAISLGLQSIGSAMIRIYHDTEETSRKDVVSTAMIGAAVANVMIAAAGFAASGLLSAHLLHAGDGNTGLLRAGFVAMVLGNWIEVAMVYQRLRDRVGLYVGYSMVQLVLLASLNIYFIVHLRMGVWGFVLSKLIVCTMGALVMCGAVLREVGFRWNGQAARRMGRFGAPLILANVAFFVIHFSDRFFLSSMRNLTEVGNYALAYRFAFLVTVLVGEPFGKVWSVNLYTFTSVPGWQRQFANVARYLVFILCFAGLALSILGPPLIRLMSTPAYYGAALVLPILVSAYVLRELGDFFRDTLFINKRSALVGTGAAVAAVVNLLLNYVLIGPFGMYGAAWATFFTWFVYMIWCWAAAYREHGIPFAARSFLLPASVATLLFVLRDSFSISSQVLGLALQTAWILLFIVLLWVFGYFPAAEKSIIQDKVIFFRRALNTWIRQWA